MIDGMREGHLTANVPVSILTGFLGSGKTTLLTRLLTHPAMLETAVLVNEIGEVGIDEALVREISDELVLLTSGCICCSVRSGLVETLEDLERRCLRGDLPRFRRVVVETTGLADPGPIVHAFLLDPHLVSGYRLDGIITTVDGWLGAGQLVGHQEAARQVAMADRLVLTKTDIAPPEAVARTRDHIARLNPRTPLNAAEVRCLHPAEVFDVSPAGSNGPAAWLGQEAGNGGGASLGEDSRNAGHLARYSTFCLELDQPVVWDDFSRWLGLLLASRAQQILRVKGIINVWGERRPIAIHGVQHIFHSPRPLARWPWTDRRTRLVFVTLDLPADIVTQSLTGFLPVS